jgi:23S rRNA pseudouridine1911/1915/1917 synthase
MLLSVIYQDKYILAINKPSGLLCHPTGQFQGDTLIQRLRHYFGPQVRLIHRLDQHTSGVMVIALDPNVVPHLYHQFEKGKTQKKYLALAQGIPNPLEGDILFPLASLDSLIKVKKKISPQGDPCHTHYRVLESSQGVSLLEVCPHSGRKHQIRAHLAEIGHPLLGDILYQKASMPFLWEYYCYRSFPFWEKNFTGHGLHAFHLEITHPVEKNRLCFCASLPVSWKNFLKQAQFSHQC